MSIVNIFELKYKILTYAFFVFHSEGFQVVFLKINHFCFIMVNKFNYSKPYMSDLNLITLRLVKFIKYKD